MQATKPNVLGWRYVDQRSAVFSEYPPVFRRVEDVKLDSLLGQAIIRGRLRTVSLAFEYEIELDPAHEWMAFAPIVGISADLWSIRLVYCVDGCVDEYGNPLFGPNGERLKPESKRGAQ